MPFVHLCLSLHCPSFYTFMVVWCLYNTVVMFDLKSSCMNTVCSLLVLFTSCATTNRSLSPLWLCQPGLSCWWNPVTVCPILAWRAGHRVCLLWPAALYCSSGSAGCSTGFFLKTVPQKGSPPLCRCHWNHWITAQGVWKLWFCAYWRKNTKRKVV